MVYEARNEEMKKKKMIAEDEKVDKIEKRSMVDNSAEKTLTQG